MKNRKKVIFNFFKAQRLYEMVIFTTGFGKLNFSAREIQIENPEMSKSAVE